MIRRDVKRLILTVLFAFVLTPALAPVPARAEAGFANPIDVLLADPFIYREGDTYYLYGTSSVSGLYVWTSEDLINWRMRGHAISRTAESWSRMHFWAPELFKHKGTYYLHYTVLGRGEAGERGDRRIVLARADSPLGPFTEYKAPWYDPGISTIDSHVFKDDDGKMYLYEVSTGTPEDNTFNINVRRLNDQLEPEEKATFCIKPDFRWEGGMVNEGPFILKKDDTYVLTYSANGYHDPNYCLGIATSKSPMGPWDKHNAEGAILHRNETISGPGHHCFTDSPDGKQMYVAYHTHQHLAAPGPPRQLAIDPVEWAQGRDPVTGKPFPTLKMTATDTLQPLPSGAAGPIRGRNDEFNTDSLNRRLWTVFSEGTPKKPNWQLKDGRLVIHTEDGDIYQDRSDLSNLFLQYAPQRDFEVTTKVAISPDKDFEQAFLILWQDHQNFAKIAYLHSKGGRKIEVGIEKASKYDSYLHEIPGLGDEVQFRIRKAGDKLDFQLSHDGRKWQTIESKSVPLIDLRVGLGACSPDGPRSIPAAFDYIRFKQ